MAWAKLDDRFADHPKIVSAGPLASWLYVCGLCYAAQYSTDGLIPPSQLRKLADVDNAQELAERLVEVGLWERVDGGFLIHDFLDYNPSAEQVKAERAANAKRQAKWRDEHRDDQGKFRSNGDSNGVTNAAVTPTPYPYPYPSPSAPSLRSEAEMGAPQADARPSPPARRDDLWDALAELLGRQPETDSERGAWNRAVKELQKARASPGDVLLRGSRYRQEWPDAELTPNALVKHWSRFGAEPSPSNGRASPGKATGFEANKARRRAMLEGGAA